MTEIPSLKNHFPFRLGCTSYVIPDDILPNVRYMAPRVDDIELVLFESDDVSNLPTKEVVSELGSIREGEGITYTVHLPIDRKIGSEDAAERHRFGEQVLRVVDLMQYVRPFSYVIHFEGITNDTPLLQVIGWQDRVREVCATIAAAEISAPVSVETLSYPFEWMLPIVREFGFSVCIDVGHVWLYRQDVAGTFRAAGERVKVIHLHGVDQGKDHLSLQRNELSDLRDLLSLVRTRQFRGVLTLEVFSARDTSESMDTLRRVWEETCRD